MTCLLSRPEVGLLQGLDDSAQLCQHKEMYDRFEKVLEGELERQLKTCGWAVADFHREVSFLYIEDLPRRAQ